MKILVADDERISLHMLEAALAASGHEVISARDGDEAFRLLTADSAPCLAILDWNMPGRNGPELCRALRRNTSAPYVYVILLTTRSATADRVAGLDAGADDFIVKPFHRDELQARVRAGVRILTMQSELAVAHEQLRELAAHDSLTGLLNRGAVLSHLDRDLARGARDRSHVAIVMVDIDHFKSVNDRFGHVAGDAVLREVTHRLNAAVRASDAIGRYGGEEFIVVLSSTDGARAAQIAERLRLGVCREPIAFEAGSLDVTCSFGVAVSGATNPCTAPSLIAAADAALYRAKRAGRNRVELSRDGAPEDAATPPNGVA